MDYIGRLGGFRLMRREGAILETTWGAEGGGAEAKMSRGRPEKKRSVRNFFGLAKTSSSAARSAKSAERLWTSLHQTTSSVHLLPLFLASSNLIGAS